MFEQLEKYTLTIGLNDKDTKTQLISRKKAISLIQNIVGDSTITDADGCYTHNNGEIVREKSLKVELLFKSSSDIIAYCEAIKKALNQESIAVSKETVTSALI